MMTTRFTITKSRPEIDRFINDAGVLGEINQAYRDKGDLFAGMIHVPNEVSGMRSEGSTYENQEKARASQIEYAIQDMANDFCEGLSKKLLKDEPDVPT